MKDIEESEIWKDYVASIDKVVYHSLLMTVGISLSYLTEHMDPTNHMAPLFESRLELLQPNLVFAPSLDPDDPHGFNHLLYGLIQDILKMSSLIPRIKIDHTDPYQAIIESHPDIIDMQQEIMDGVNKVVQEAAEFCRGFERYSYLWLEDRLQCMELFLEYGRILDVDEVEEVALKEPNAPQPCAPSIEAFREQIDIYESLTQEVEDIPAYEVFNAWFQVDVRPFRQALINIVRKWGNMFKEHLVNRVTNNLCDLAEFIRKADEGLLQTVKEGDYEGLVNIMAYLMHVKERAVVTDEMFEPMQVSKSDRRVITE